MRLQLDVSGDVMILRIEEDKLVYSKLSDFLSQVRELVESGTRKLVLDLSRVRYVDSATIGCLMDVHRLVRERSGSVKLVGLQNRVRTVISMTGLLKLMEVFAEEEAALASF